METKWLEDFVSLAETRSFSRSAQLRHVTQPAFSRRIQALEAWAGVDLVDRSTYPTRLTPAGRTLYDQAIDMLQAMHNTRAMLRAHGTSDDEMIEFAVPHTLSLAFFPEWVSAIRTRFGPFKSRLIALNVHDAVMRLVEGNCDLVVAYHHASQPFPLDTHRYDVLTLGQEVLAPYSRPGADGAPLFALPGSVSKPLPYLAYAPSAYFGRLTDLILKESAPSLQLERVYETDMAEGLKAMALEGHGVAFLPASAVKNELEAQRLVSAAHAGLSVTRISMEVRLCRERPAQKDRASSRLDALWDFLASQYPVSTGS